MADERTWALTGRLLMFALLLGCSFGLGGVYGYSRGQQAAPPLPDPEPIREWHTLTQAKARSYGLPDVPRDGMARYPSAWQWEHDQDGRFRYERVRGGVMFGEVEISHQPLGASGGNIGEVKP